MPFSSSSMQRSFPYATVAGIASIYLLTAILKSFLIPFYRSTDFDVHRNWLAVTYSLPISQWYRDGPWAPSQWTLDYPPVFAYFEKVLATVAAGVAYSTNSDNLWKMLDPLAQDAVAPQSVVVFQRLTVILSDLTLIPGVLLLCPSLRAPMKTLRYLGLLYMLAMPALLLIDHVHFQYNGMLLGVYFSAIGLMQRGKVLAGAVTFTLLVLSKHIFAYAAPAIGVWLLCNYCMVTRFYQPGTERTFSFRRFFGLVAGDPSLCCSSVTMVNCSRCSTRMFPFGRGLTHAYWAPNLWALYYGADVVLAKLKGLPGSAFTHGLVQVMDPTVLPPVRPIHALLATVVVYLPILTGIVRESGRPNGSQRSLLFWATMGTSASFLCGWHVHEKALVTVVAPFMLEIILKRDLHGSSRYVTAVASLSTLMMASLLPLLPDSLPELGLKWALMLFSWSIDCCLASMTSDGGRLHRFVVVITAAVCVTYRWVLPSVLPLDALRSAHANERLLRPWSNGISPGLLLRMLGRRRALAVVLGTPLDGAALETSKFLFQSVRYKRYRPFVRTPTPSQRALAQENWLKRRRRYGTPGSSKDTASASGDAEEIILKNTPYQALRLLRAFYNTDTVSRITFDVDIRVDLTRQSVRGVVQLPYGLKTEIRVLALCPDYMASEMLEAGRTTPASSEPLNKIERGWLPFDKVIALPQVIPQVVKLAKILGPKEVDAECTQWDCRTKFEAGCD
ncbi:glycosyl transferase [Perkinsus olseni]|uniref:Alpha-1,3-glucosyltransferase n=1 Tax=Perkinsus olseni TaxID=32597 RepID=A0A7J6P4J2_PEROL|nr:glycosyl transferase [Perkinsus olseni]